MVFFFVEDDFRRILGVTAGLFCLLVAIWYAAHPFLQDEHTHPELRSQVRGFVDLTTELHYARESGSARLYGPSHRPPESSPQTSCPGRRLDTTLSSVVFFFVEDDFRRILGVTAGLFCLLVAIWYAAHPFLQDEHTHPEFRSQVRGFVDLTTELHYAALRGDEAGFESIRERIPDQVQAVIDTARKSRAPGPG